MTKSCSSHRWLYIAPFGSDRFQENASTAPVDGNSFELEPFSGSYSILVRYLIVCTVRRESWTSMMKVGLLKVV